MPEALEINATPLVLAVAPTGARRTKADHAALPITPAEVARETARAHEAGAAMLHLHVRDSAGLHSIDADLYREATAAVRAAVGDRMVVQITTEAVGRFTPEEQIACVRAVRPEAASIAIREICPPGGDETALADLSLFMAREKIAPQFILYDVPDVERFLDLRRRGVLVAGTVLYVLGRYAVGQRSSAADLLPFVRAGEGAGLPWSLCAFGPEERACALTAAALGGHVRVGFENNMWLPDGTPAPDNAALVAGIAARATDLGRRLADADETRRMGLVEFSGEALQPAV
jgi:3-keto-5-aminohexanoate cleavage enzyme